MNGTVVVIKRSLQTPDIIHQALVVLLFPGYCLLNLLSLTDLQLSKFIHGTIDRTLEILELTAEIRNRAVAVTRALGGSLGSTGHRLVVLRLSLVVGRRIHVDGGRLNYKRTE